MHKRIYVYICTRVRMISRHACALSSCFFHFELYTCTYVYVCICVYIYIHIFKTVYIYYWYICTCICIYIIHHLSSIRARPLSSCISEPEFENLSPCIQQAATAAATAKATAQRTLQQLATNLQLDQRPRRAKAKGPSPPPPSTHTRSHTHTHTRTHTHTHTHTHSVFDVPWFQRCLSHVTNYSIWCMLQTFFLTNYSMSRTILSDVCLMYVTNTGTVSWVLCD